MKVFKLYVSAQLQTELTASSIEDAVKMVALMDKAIVANESLAYQWIGNSAIELIEV